MSNTPDPVTIEPARVSLLRRTSAVWLIPITALVAAMVIAWQSYADRGPLITVIFENGTGIAARETELRYRDIKVGIVEEVNFTDDLSAVEALIRLDKDVAPYVDAGASFWVVHPELTARGVSGLDTVLSGVFIEGSWDSDIGLSRSSFKGLSDAPLFRPGQEGLQIALRTTPGGSLTDNSPILFRGIEVGRIGRARISPHGGFAIAEAIIYEPHGQLVTSSTRFWDSSGFSVNIGPSGAEIDFSSLASLVAGGLEFDTFASGGTPVVDGTVFEVYPDKPLARNSIFNTSEVETLQIRVVFDDNIPGLVVGSPVELGGLRIGSVENISGFLETDQFGNNAIRLNAVLGIQPARLGLQGEVTPAAALNFFASQVSDGLRARLASASLLTGGLKVELLQVDNAGKDVAFQTGDGLPTMPTTESNISGAADSVEGVFNRINKLPIEELLQSAIGFLNTAQAFVADDAFRETPGEIRDMIDDMRTLVTSQDMQNVPVALNATLTRLDSLLTDLEKQQIVAGLAATLNAAASTARTLDQSLDGLPGLITQIEGVARKAETLPLEALIHQLTGLLESAGAIVGTDAAQALPASLTSALDEMGNTLADLREGGAITNANAALSSARQAADAVARSTRDLPALAIRLTEVLDQASRTIAGYDHGDALGRDAQSALQDISEASKAITALVRLLERDPSALIRGR